MKKLYLLAAILPALALTACEDAVPYQKELETVGASKAVKVLTTEDGTVLWAYDPPNESTVYFSTGGTTRLVKFPGSTGAPSAFVKTRSWSCHTWPAARRSSS